MKVVRDIVLLLMLGVVAGEVGVEQLDVSLDGGAIGRQLPQIGAPGHLVGKYIRNSAEFCN
jgi:hypothetical protein